LAVALLAAAAGTLLAGPVVPARVVGWRVAGRPALRPVGARTRSRLACAVAGAVGWWVGGAGGAFAGVALAASAVELTRRRQTARMTAACRSAVPLACRTIAAELAAGLPPAAALGAAAASAPAPLAGVLTGASAAEPLGVDPATVLAARPPPGCERLVLVAACWTVCSHAGGGLAGALSRLADGLSDEQDAAAEVAAELVGPRMSALVMALLPVVGIALGTALGARPLAFLTTTAAGLACLAAGCALDAAGLLWVNRIARAATG
jgi:tight adherence protein B